MNTNLQYAITYLRNNPCTCVLYRDGKLFSSPHRGVRPLLDFLDSGNSFAGFSAADKVVGRATAFLYCLLGVEAVHALVLSDAAAAVFREYGVFFSCDVQVPGIRNRNDSGPCPMEQATQDIRDPESALIAIRAALKALSQTA